MADTDVVLFGPTGVTGREVARHLAARAPQLGLRWAVAGRDRTRIESVLDGLPSRPDDVLVADVADPGSIEAMVTSSKVVANLVGPYARHGEPVYRACAAHGVHELDLTGEIDWVRSMIDAYDDLATDTGARIVPTSGFESLPFDLGTLFAAHALHERTGDPVVSVDVAVSITADSQLSALTDAVSGGTYISMMEALRRGPGPVLTDPYVLDTPSSTASGRYDLRPRKHPGSGQWLAPMFPAPYLNPPVVHRSAALLRDSEDPIFHPDFAFREGTATDTTVPRPAAGAAAAALSVLTTGMAALGRIPEGAREPVTKWLLAAGPKSGDGPRPEDLDAWRYRLDILATDVRGARLEAVVEGDGHPGYKSTATMVGEAALALADPAAGVPDGAGFLTPATALGLGTLDRFDAAGLRFRLA